MKRLTDNELDALETVWSDIRRSDRSPHFWPGNSFDPAVQFMLMARDAFPALLAEVRELRRLTTPEPISEKHRDGNWWLVWYWPTNEWMKMKWRYDDRVWQTDCGLWPAKTPTHALPLPGRPEGEP